MNWWKKLSNDKMKLCSDEKLKRRNNELMTMKQHNQKIMTNILKLSKTIVRIIRQL